MLAIIVTLLVILLDIVTKYLTVQILVPLGGDVTVIPHILDFSYVENRGAAWGMFADHRWVFMLLSSIMIIALILFLRCSGIKHHLFVISASMILGGGIGNMIDRVFLGYVVDFLKVTFIDFPVFNIADSAVVIGTVLLAVYLIFFDKEIITKEVKGNEN